MEFNKLKDLFVNRYGVKQNSYMKTTDLLDFFTPNQILEKNGNMLNKIASEINNYYLTLPLSYTKPKQVIIQGKINEKSQNLNMISNNILGSNDFFYCDIDSSVNTSISIPIVESDEKFLAYYNVYYIKDKQIFNLNNNEDVGLFQMEIGENYVNEYLLKDGLGDGFYIETHDLPHYYWTEDVNSQGYIILGEKMSDGFGLTAFKVGINKGLYISPYTYHSDAYLIGKYNVIYGKTSNYKTYLFKNNNISKSIVNVKCE